MQQQIAQTVTELGAVLRRSADCRQALAREGRDWRLLPDALALLDDLDEHAITLVTRAGLVTAPPPPASRAWRTNASVH